MAYMREADLAMDITLGRVALSTLISITFVHGDRKMRLSWNRSVLDPDSPIHLAISYQTFTASSGTGSLSLSLPIVAQVKLEGTPLILESFLSEPHCQIAHIMPLSGTSSHNASMLVSLGGNRMHIRMNLSGAGIPIHMKFAGMSSPASPQRCTGFSSLCFHTAHR